jgi:predicted metal-dependent hydrolase
MKRASAPPVAGRPALAEPILVDLGGHSVAVTVRRSAQARRLSLRLDPVAGPVVVMPTKARLSDAEHFLNQHRIWLAQRLARQPDSVPFTPGARVPLLGIDHEIRHVPTARRGVWAEDAVLHVCGQIDHVPRRVTDFFKAEAKRVITPHAFALSARIGRTPCRLTVRDTRSRWGSCSSGGDLSFSWRLVLAPEAILTYVVAHEVAHLAEMNHSPAFWDIVRGLIGDPGAARRWLKANGARLHRYG